MSPDGESMMMLVPHPFPPVQTEFLCLHCMATVPVPPLCGEGSRTVYHNTLVCLPCKSHYRHTRDGLYEFEKGPSPEDSPLPGRELGPEDPF